MLPLPGTSLISLSDWWTLFISHDPAQVLVHLFVLDRLPVFNLRALFPPTPGLPVALSLLGYAYK